MLRDKVDRERAIHVYTNSVVVQEIEKTVYDHLGEIHSVQVPKIASITTLDRKPWLGLSIADTSIFFV